MIRFDKDIDRTLKEQRSKNKTIPDNKRTTERNTKVDYDFVNRDIVKPVEEPEKPKNSKFDKPSGFDDMENTYEDTELTK